MAEKANIRAVYRGDDQELRFTLTTNGAVTGWTTKFTARTAAQAADPPALQVSGTIIDGGSSTTPGVFSVVISQAAMLALLLTGDRREYAYAFRRTNAGAQATLTKGLLTVESDIEHAI